MVISYSVSTKSWWDLERYIHKSVYDLDLKFVLIFRGYNLELAIWWSYLKHKISWCIFTKIKPNALNSGHIRSSVRSASSVAWNIWLHHSNATQIPQNLAKSASSWNICNWYNKLKILENCTTKNVLAGQVLAMKK